MAKDRLQHCPLVVGLSDRIFSKTYNISLPKVAEWKSKVLQDGAEDILPLIILNFDNVFFNFHCKDISVPNMGYQSVITNK